MAQPTTVAEAIKAEERDEYRGYKDRRYLFSVAGALIAVVGATIMFAAYLNYENITALKEMVEVTYNTTRASDFEATAAKDWHAMLLATFITAFAIPVIAIPVSYLFGTRTERLARMAVKEGAQELACELASAAQVAYAIVALLTFAGSALSATLAIHSTIMHENDFFMDADYHFLIVLIGGYIATGGLLVICGLHVYQWIKVGGVAVCETSGVRGAMGRGASNVSRGARSFGSSVGNKFSNLRQRVGFAPYPNYQHASYQ